MPDDTRERLRRMGVNVSDGWSGDVRPGTREAALPPMLMRQRDLLIKLRDVVAVQLEADRTKVTELHEKLNRLKHGGGR